MTSDARDELKLLGAFERLEDSFRVGVGVIDIFADALALLRREGGDKRENAAHGGANVVNVIHHANGFAGEWHVCGPRIELM